MRQLRYSKGFSLIELGIGLVVMGVLLAFAMPQFTLMVANSKVRAAAEALASGLQMAKSEAIKQNIRVEFILTDEEPIAATVGSAAATTTGPNWMIRSFSPLNSAYSFVEGKLGLDGAGQATEAVSIASSSTDTDYVGRVTFTNLGTNSYLAAGAAPLTMPTADLTFAVTAPASGTCQSAGGAIRCLNVQVLAGGQIRLCDPQATGANDTRAC